MVIFCRSLVLVLRVRFETKLGISRSYAKPVEAADIGDDNPCFCAGGGVFTVF
jgi:hypothetical protein